MSICELSPTATIGTGGGTLGGASGFVGSAGGCGVGSGTMRGAADMHSVVFVNCGRREEDESGALPQRTLRPGQRANAGAIVLDRGMGPE